MKRSILLADVAEDDIEQASLWYSGRSKGLDHRFLHALANTLDHVAEHPMGSTRIRGRIRQFPLKGFPYIILFAVYPKEILVRRVFHTRRHPKRKMRGSS